MHEASGSSLQACAPDRGEIRGSTCGCQGAPHLARRLGCAHLLGGSACGARTVDSQAQLALACEGGVRAVPRSSEIT